VEEVFCFICSEETSSRYILHQDRYPFCSDACKERYIAHRESGYSSQEIREKYKTVTDANKEAAGMLQNDNHKTANDKVLTATKKALKASIKDKQGGDAIK
jgi:hypothetical protein